MEALPPYTARQQLPHLRIDPFSASSPLSTSPLRTPDRTSIASSTLCSVLCMYDFGSDDPDHLSFCKHEILDIVKKEESGWWAAIRNDGDQIGWIPEAFVNTLSDEMAERLRHTRKELRGYEYNAEQLYTSAPTQSTASSLYEPPEPSVASPNPVRRRLDDRERRTSSPHMALSKAQETSHSSPHSDPRYRHIFRNRKSSREFLSPTLAPAHKSAAFPPASSDEDVPQTRNRAGTLPNSAVRRRPSRLRTLHEAASFAGLSKGFASERQSRPTPLEAERQQSTERPRPSPPQSTKLAVDPDGQVIYGTMDAFIEKLTSDNPDLDSLKMEKETVFRSTFLVTFRTFMTADALFNRLVEIYRMEPPDETPCALDGWKTRHTIAQRRVLMIFTMWLEDYRLLDEEPHIANQLTEFLRAIMSPPLASMARLLTKSIQRLTFTTPTIPTSTVTVVTPRKAKKSKTNKKELVKLDPVDVAEQITLLEFQRYNRVTPNECLRHATGKQNVGALSAFCSTHDKLVFWVKISVLEHDALGKRADTIEFWIKVAEKCKGLNNFASMSAIITALSSTVITRLHLTWAHVGRKTAYEALSRYNDPTGNFAGYRNLIRDVEGSCIPFVIMFLTELVHIHDQYTDEGERICFLKRQRWCEIVNAMLRYQSRPYDIAESESTMGFVTKHLRDLEEGWKDHNWFWSRSQEVQHTEMAHADIRKGLEAAGF